MQEKGLEPSCCCQHTDLNRARLPFRHSCVSFFKKTEDKIFGSLMREKGLEPSRRCQH